MSIKSYTQDDTISYFTGSDENLENEICQGSDNEFSGMSVCSQKDLIDTKMLAQIMDSENSIQGENQRCKPVKHHRVENLFKKLNVTKCQNEDHMMNQHEGVDNKTLQVKLENLTRELEEVRLSNIHYQENQNQQNQIEDVRQQVEMETASTILQLQEEVETLQIELNDRLHSLAQENTQLKDALSAKNEEMRMLCIDWETAMIELTSFLLDSSRSIRDAHGQIEGIANLFPIINVGIGEQVQRAIEVCIGKEETILFLHKSLEDARLMVQDMELKLDSLKEASSVLNELQQMHDNISAADAKQSSTQMTGENIMVEFLEKRLRVKNDQLIEAEKSADASSFIAVEWLSNSQELSCCNNTGREMPISKLDFSSQRSSRIFDDVMANTNALLLQEPDTISDLICLGLLELKNITNAYYADMEMHISALHIDFQDIYSEYQELVQDMVREIHELRLKAKTTNENCKSIQYFKDKAPSAQKCWNIENQNSILDQIKAEIYEAKNRLNILEESIDRNIAGCREQLNQYPVKEDGWSSDSSTSSSDISTESVTSRGKLLDYMNGDGGTTTCLRKELCMTYDAIHKLCIKVDAILMHDIGGDSLSEGKVYLYNLFHW